MQLSILKKNIHLFFAALQEALKTKFCDFDNFECDATEIYKSGIKSETLEKNVSKMFASYTDLLNSSLNNLVFSYIGDLHML